METFLQSPKSIFKIVRNAGPLDQSCILINSVFCRLRVDIIDVINVCYVFLFFLTFLTFFCQRFYTYGRNKEALYKS